MNKLISFITLLLSISAKPKETDRRSDLPICVIGAGISGLNTAHRLKEKGYAVKVFEKTNRVGGKFEAYRKDGKVWNMGPVLITDQYIKTKKIIDKYNIETSNFSIDDHVAYNQETGVSIVLPSIVNNPLIISAFERYRTIRKRLNVDPGYKNVSEELFIPSIEWLEKNLLISLVPVMTIFVTGEGYGSLFDTPAIYMIHILDLIGDIRGKVYTLSNGYDEITNNYAKGLDITLNTKVSVVRRKSSSTLTYTNDKSKDNVQECQSVVLAFPPVTKYVADVVPALTNDEIKVLNEISITKYASFANIATNLAHKAYVPFLSLDLNLGDGRPILFTNQTRGAFVSYAWTRGDFKEPPTDADMANYSSQLKKVFPKLNPGQEAQASVLGKSWTYFPHVDIESLKNGFYNKFDKIQGFSGLYYATPLITVETIERSIDASDYLVDNYF